MTPSFGVGMALGGRSPKPAADRPYRRDEHLFGPDLRTALVGLGVATALSAVFGFLVSNAAHPAYAAVGGALWLCVLITWLLAATTQPGIVPQSLPLSAEDASRVAQVGRSVTMPDGRLMPLRWCYHCRVFRPPRAVHCPDCGVCVMRFDHHCPWVSQCVGQRNYAHFYAFLWAVSLLCAYTGGCLSLYAFGLLSWDRRAYTGVLGEERSAALYNGILVVAVAIGVLVGVLCVAPLAVFHSSLLAADATTSQADRTAYARPSAAANCAAVLCGAEAAYAALRDQCEAALAEAAALAARRSAPAPGGAPEADEAGLGDGPALGAGCAADASEWRDLAQPLGACWAARHSGAERGAGLEPAADEGGAWRPRLSRAPSRGSATSLASLGSAGDSTLPDDDLPPFLARQPSPLSPARPPPRFGGGAAGAAMRLRASSLPPSPLQRAKSRGGAPRGRHEAAAAAQVAAAADVALELLEGEAAAEVPGAVAASACAAEPASRAARAPHRVQPER